MNLFHHETIYRGKDTLAKIKNFPLVICGAGAIGSNLAENLVRQGFGNLTAIDKDRIEDRNVNTQIWTKRDIGAVKVEMLKSKLFEITGIEIETIYKELKIEKQARRLFRDARLIVDAFDNSKSRRLIKAVCSTDPIFGSDCSDCLHIGFSGDYGEIIWNQDYRVPDDKGEDNCDYPLARNLIIFLTGVASEVIVRFVTKGEKKGYTITLEDFKIERYRE